MAKRPSSKKVKSPKVRREVPLVELEYLNLTASAIYMKYNRKGDPYNQLNLTSQELVQAAQNLPFYNIYDFMCDYVESKRRRFEEKSLYLEMDNNPVFQKGTEVVWQRASGDTLTGEVIKVYRDPTSKSLMLSVSNGSKRYEVRALEVSVVPRRQQRKPKSWISRWFKG